MSGNKLNLTRVKHDFTIMMAPMGEMIAQVQVNGSKALIGYAGQSPVYYDWSRFCGRPASHKQVIDDINTEIEYLHEQIDILQQWLSRINS